MPGDTYTPIFDFNAALGAAKNLQEKYPMYVVRIDCTIGQNMRNKEIPDEVL
jgi:hypothetical protein